MEENCSSTDTWITRRRISYLSGSIERWHTAARAPERRGTVDPPIIPISTRTNLLCVSPVVRYPGVGAILNPSPAAERIFSVLSDDTGHGNLS